MTDPVFIRRARTLTVAEIATMTGAEPLGQVALDRKIDDIAPLDRAGPRAIAFLDSPRFAAQLASTHAGACLTSERFAGQAPRRVIVLRAREPYRAFVKVAQALFPDALRPSPLYEAEGVAPAAVVHPSARLEPGARVEPGAVIGPRAEIGSGTLVAPNAVIGPDVRIGRDSAIGAGASITHALIGDRVIIHPGCRIGQDGFGFVMGADGHLKMPQIGRVIIQDDVEIGAGTAIDRGATRDTVIGEGTKIDNHVQVGHNVSIGRHCVVVAQTGISGSSTLEDFVALGARVGLNNQVTIGEGAQIAATSVVRGDVPAGERWGGIPAKPVKQWFREMFTLERLARESAERPAEASKDD